MISAINYSYVVIGILAVIIVVGVFYYLVAVRPVRKEHKDAKKKKHFYNDIR